MLAVSSYCGVSLGSKHCVRAVSAAHQMDMIPRGSLASVLKRIESGIVLESRRAPRQYDKLLPSLTKDRDPSAVTIQRYWRGCFSRLFDVNFELVRLAVCVLQKAFRSYRKAWQRKELQDIFIVNSTEDDRSLKVHPPPGASQDLNVWGNWLERQQR